MKNISKKVILIIIILMLLFSINAKVFAWSSIMSGARSFINAASSDTGDINSATLQELSGYLYNILLAAGVVIAVIVATILGIQFMLGGAEGQAKVKEMLIPFVVGCIIVFGGFAIWKVAITVGESLEAVATTRNIQETQNENIIYETLDSVLITSEQHREHC